MKVYVATAVKNRQQAKHAAGILADQGHEITYDWMQTVDNPDKSMSWTDIANMEMKGVQEADYLVLLFPGNRGTHAELGIALASNIKVIICAENATAFYRDGEICPYYMHRLVDFIIGDFDYCLEYVINVLEMEAKKYERWNMQKLRSADLLGQVKEKQ